MFTCDPRTQEAKAGAQPWKEIRCLKILNTPNIKNPEADCQTPNGKFVFIHSFQCKQMWARLARKSVGHGNYTQGRERSGIRERKVRGSATGPCEVNLEQCKPASSYHRAQVNYRESRSVQAWWPGPAFPACGTWMQQGHPLLHSLSRGSLGYTRSYF